MGGRAADDGGDPRDPGVHHRGGRAPPLRAHQHGEPGGDPPPLHLPDRVRRVHERAHRGRDGGRPLVRGDARARRAADGRRGARVHLLPGLALRAHQQPDADLGAHPGRAGGRRTRLRDPRDGARPARRAAPARARRGPRRRHLRGGTLRLRSLAPRAQGRRLPRPRGRDGGARRRDRRGQDDAREPGAALLRPHRRARAARRHRRARVPAEGAPPAGGDGPPARARLPDHGAREHRLRPARRDPGADPRGGPPGAARRLPRAAPGGPRDGGGRGGRHALRRRAAAHHDRPRDPP